MLHAHKNLVLWPDNETDSVRMIAQQMAVPIIHRIRCSFGLPQLWLAWCINLQGDSNAVVGRELGYTNLRTRIGALPSMLCRTKLAR